MQLNIGTKIRELRRRDGRTQEALADALGVTSQAVSRWESGGSYPDMEIMPSIANYFGVSIDELFGYHDDRSKKIDELVERIRTMNSMNNGVDINIDECIALAREALIEFPGNERLMLCLASVLFNAGYVRYGEYHLIDEDGFNVNDVETHRGYAEWKEAMLLYEKVLKTMEAGVERNVAIGELTQLYLNLGESGRALAIVESAPNIYGSKEFLKCKAFDGKKKAQAYSECLAETARACADLMVGCAMVYEQHMTPAEKVRSLRGAIDLFGLVYTDGNYGIRHGYVARVYSLLSVYLWLDGKHDEAFAALDDALSHYKRYEACLAEKDGGYTAPLVCLLPYESVAEHEVHPATSLAEDWPWWSVQEYTLVKDEIQADPRWAAWVAKLQG